MDYAPDGTVTDLIKASKKDPSLLSEDKCRILMKALL